MSKFISHFADNLEAMLSYREALGFRGHSHEPHLLNFDRYAATNCPDLLLLEKIIVIGWLDELMEKGVRTLSAKASAIRLFGKYLTAIGQMAYVLPDEYVSQPQNFTPYIFTDDELSRLFYATDRLPKGFIDVTATQIMPVMLRLIYTCGLRPNEARELPYENVNFKTGEIFITKTKRKKERLIVMSGDMLDFMKRYDVIAIPLPQTVYIFSHGKTVLLTQHLNLSVCLKNVGLMQTRASPLKRCQASEYMIFATDLHRQF